MAQRPPISRLLSAGAAVLAGAAALLVPPACAQEDNGARLTTAKLVITTQVANACEIGGTAVRDLTAIVLDLGERRFDAGEPTEASLDLPVCCNDATIAPRVRFSRGANANAGGRHLRGPEGRLVAYELLRGREPSAEPWDDGSHAIALGPDGVGVIPISGRVIGLPDDVVDGRYTDMIVITIGLDN